MDIYQGTKVNSMEYRTYVQTVQTICLSFGLEYRFKPVYNKENYISRSYFEVYCDGRWWTIGEETPFVPEEERNSEIYSTAWQLVYAKAGYYLYT